jgi:hypothetical protein
MAVNPETLGNFSNPVVPKAPKAPRISMGDLSQASQTASDMYKAEGEAAVQKSMGEAQATRDAAYQTSDIQRAAREPILKELSTVSKGVDFKPTQETFIGMSSLAGLIAFIGTASGKYGASSGRGAIDAMTGMMKGYQTGRQDVFRREQIQFEKEMASLKATQDRLYKELEIADKTALIDSAKASADRAVAVAASGSDFLKASYNTKGARGVKEDLFKFMDAQQKADTMAQNLGIAREKMAQARDLAAAKASNQGVLKPSAKAAEGYVAQNILSNDLGGLANDLKNPNLQKQISDYRVGSFLTQESKILNQLISPNMPTELRQFLTKVIDIRNNVYLSISGSAVTGSEALRNYGAVPQPGDTSDVMIDKISSMKNRVDKKIQTNQYLFKFPPIPPELIAAGTKTSLILNKNYENTDEEEIINVPEDIPGGASKGKYKKSSSGSYIRLE